MSKRAILIGSGKSVRAGIELGLWDKVKDQETWSVNSIFKIMPYVPNKEVFVDNVFCKHELTNLQKLYEQGVELITKKYNMLAFLDKQICQYNSSRELKHYYGRKAIEKNIIFYGRMGLSGHFALAVAVARGYEEIFLLGYDFGSPSLQDRDTHVFQNDIPRLNILATGACRPEVYLDKKSGKPFRWIEDWSVYLGEQNLKIWNVSPQSNIPYFEKIDYTKFFELIGEENGTTRMGKDNGNLSSGNDMLGCN